MKKRLIIESLLILLILINSCQGLIDFIPPDFEEKLCVNAVINNGRNQNKIIIEKTFQYEYPSEVQATLEDLSVIIRSESEVVFEYSNTISENRIDTIYLPADLVFTPNQKYTLTISEKNSESITCEIVVPYPPRIPEISIEGSVQTFLSPPMECHNPVKSIVLSVKFTADEDCFYYLDIEGHLIPFYVNIPVSLIDYDIIESNTPNFKTFIDGFKSIGFSNCNQSFIGIIPMHPYKSCFFDSKIIPKNNCNIKIKIDRNSYYDYTRPIKITLISISKELYAYKKSYYTYYETVNDPFSEPVYLSGNIIHGYGIFAICSGSHTSLILPAF